MAKLETKFTNNGQNPSLFVGIIESYPKKAYLYIVSFERATYIFLTIKWTIDENNTTHA